MYVPLYPAGVTPVIVTVSPAVGDSVLVIVTVVGGQYWVAPALVAQLLEVVRTFAGPAVNDANKGRAGMLTRREREVLALVVAGYANKEIARTFSVSEETVKHHLTRMFDKVGAANRVELARVATERRLVSDT